MERYDPKKIESKWQAFWEKEKAFEVREDESKKKFYGLIEFPYPSGAGLHVGHPRSYTAMDVICRKRRMEGQNVLFPIGFDAFGLPTENFAIKTGRPPAEVTAENIANFTRQLKSLGFSFDWSRAVDTTDPAYYKWTQWIFLQFFKHGLAYKKKQPINWCPKDKIGLANEEVVDGCCERCGGPVEKREKEQWMLSITKYADSLLEGLKDVDYIERAKVQQKNWIGRSEGALIGFRVQGSGFSIEVFTTRPDTIFGATYIVLAPEHDIISKLENQISNLSDVESYIADARRKTDMERSALGKEKTGVELNGVKAVNPANGEEISIWVADYVLGSYGTGAIMAVPAHDERDFAFARKFGLPIKEVVIQQIGTRLEDRHERRTVRGICVRDGKMLITQDKRTGTNEYILPGGGVEEGEGSENSLLREVREETGYTSAKIISSLGTIEHNFYHHYRKNNRISTVSGYVFELENDEVIPRTREEIEKGDFFWLPIQEAREKLKDSPTFSLEVEFIDRFLKGHNNLFSENGVAFNSDFLSGLSTNEAKEKIIAWLEEKGVGKRQVQYKLRDWVFSRQRYWGEPIPLVHCDVCRDKKYNYIIIHGFTSNSHIGFKPWLEKELCERGHKVWNPDLPNTNTPNIDEQAQFILDNAPFPFDEHTVLVGHSLGGPVLYKILEKIKKSVAKAVFVDPVIFPEFTDVPRPELNKSCDWNFDWKKIKAHVGEVIILADANFPVIKKEHLEELAKNIGGGLQIIYPNVRHFSTKNDAITAEPLVLEAALPSGWIPLPESELPLKLPKVEKYQPTDTGESPLAAMTDWVNTICPKCGGSAKRETDTMPNWAGSSWYFLRYADPENKKELASKKALEYWMPVDWYNGGMEHTVLHLLYSRFWNQFLFDIGVAPTREPYAKRTSHGLIMGPDGEKMSKSRGNVVNPDEMVEQYGADALRMYILFMGPFDQPVAWDTNGLVGVKRFLERIWKLQEKLVRQEVTNPRLLSIVHQIIKKVTEDVEAMRFNTAIAKLMELCNEMYKSDWLSADSYQLLLKLLSPFAPHIAEELWNQTGEEGSIAFAEWPTYDESLIKTDTVTIAVQINGKLRDTFEADVNLSEQDAKQIALSQPNVAKHLDGKAPKKVIYVKGKLVSIVL